jgi:hypothetical protein
MNGQNKPSKPSNSSKEPESKSSVHRSGVNTFKTVQVKRDRTVTTDEENVTVLDENLDGSQLAFVPMRSSTPNVTSNVSEELDDLGIQMVQDLLSKHYGYIAGLQYVGYGEFRGTQLPKFSCAEGLPFVQILNVGDHWLCVTNVFGTSTHDIYVFDSLQRKKLSHSAITQISTILPNDNSSEELTIHVRKFVRQPVRSRACGLYASAAAFACVNREDPTGFFYEVTELRDAISQRVLEDHCDSLPGTKRWSVTDVSMYKVRKVYCCCH